LYVYKVSSLLEVDPLFAKGNPNIAKADKSSSIYEGIVATNKFRTTVTITESDGKLLPPFVVAYNGEYFNYLDLTGSSRLTVSKTISSDPDGSIVLGNPILLPYSFLKPSISSLKFPLLKPADILDRPLWETALSKATIVKEDEKLITLKVPIAKGYYEVSFSRENSYYPVTFKRYEDDWGLIQDVDIKSNLDENNDRQDTLCYPKEIKIIINMRKSKLWTIIAKTDYCNKIDKVLDEVDDSFTIDPTSADDVFDRDRQVLIPVPR